MNRISVVGPSGSGKTTIARSIAKTLDVPLLELDSVYHQMNWEPLSDPEFRRRAEDFSVQPKWVIDGNYTTAGVLDVVWSAADTVVWVDMPRRVVMTQVIRRSTKRAFTGEELWNGNTESVSRLLKWDPEENIVRWAWTRFSSTRAKYEARSQDPASSHLTIHRLRSRQDAADFVGGLGR